MSTVFTCPACGASLVVGVLRGGARGWQRDRQFPIGEPGAAELSREMPVGKASVESDVRVPLLQAAITALVITLVTATVTVARHWHWTTPILIGVITFALAWWLLLLDHRKLLRQIETVVGQDLDGDGQVGFTVEIVDKTDGKKQIKYIHFPARPGEVKRFAQAALEGQLTVYGRHHLSRGTYERLRDEAMSRGLLAWRGEARNQGVELTAVGRHVFSRLVAEDSF